MSHRNKKTSVLASLDTRSLSFVNYHVSGLGYTIGQHFDVKSKEYSVPYRKIETLQKRYIPLVVSIEDNVVYDLQENVLHLKENDIKEIRERFLDLGFDFEIIEGFPWQEFEQKGTN